MFTPLSAPKISIIIPSLNQGEYIEETILSILNQAYKNIEIIIIDGGSTDETISVIKKYETQITYWISEKDKGQSNAINKGLMTATGDIITWLNSDDYYEPGTLDTIMKLFENNQKTDIVHGKARLFGQQIKSALIGLENDIPLYEYLPYMRFPQPSSFYKKEFLSRDCPVKEHLHYAMDFELVARAILSGANIKRTDELLSHYRLHPGSKSNDEIKFLNEWTMIVYGIFCSVENGLPFAKKMEILGLAKITASGNANNHLIESNISFTSSEIEIIFLEHLHLHYHYNYRLFNYAQCRFLSAFLKENYNSFYNKNQYNKYNFRLKFIPKFVFGLIRRRVN